LRMEVGQYQPFLSTLWPISAFDHDTPRSGEFIRSHVFRFT
jgi:hypothetical protein